MLQDSLIPNLDYLRLLFGFSFIGLSIYFWLYSCFTYKLPLFLKATNLLLLLFTVYGLELYFSGEVLFVQRSGHRVSNATFIISIYNSILPLFAFYTFSKRKLINQKKLEHIVNALFYIVLFNYFIARIIYSHSPGNNSLDDFTNNASYGCVALLPLLLVFKNKPQRYYIMLAILVALIVLSMKRGAILIAGIIVIIQFLYIFKTQSHSGRLKSFFIAIILLSIGYLGFTYFVNHNSFAQERIELTKEGYSSGRDVLYEAIFLHLNSIDKKQLYLGSGAWSTLNVTDNYAHSDWLEIAVDEGLLGVFIYVLFWIALIVSVVKIKNNQICQRIVFLFFILYFLKSIMSMSYSEMGVVAGLGIGFFLGEASPTKYKRKRI